MKRGPMGGVHTSLAAKFREFFFFFFSRIPTYAPTLTLAFSLRRRFYRLHNDDAIRIVREIPPGGIHAEFLILLYKKAV